MFPRSSSRAGREKIPPGASLNCCPAPNATEGLAFTFEAPATVQVFWMSANRGAEFCPGAKRARSVLHQSLLRSTFAKRSSGPEIESQHRLVRAQHRIAGESLNLP
jgi:hypothetical protein